MKKNLNILITGGTGSFGKKFVELTLKRYNPRRLVVFSRDEMKQWFMQRDYANEKRLRFFLGDVRDKDRLNRALDGIDYVVHAAANKIVTTAEYNPFETVKTNILGAMNLIDVCINRGIKKVIALSTDKACNPVNFYGATKLASDKLFVAGNSYSNYHRTKFSVVRYGNVMGSRGSIIPFLLKQKKNNKEFTLTHPEMTRFMTTLESSVNQVWNALSEMKGGEIFVRKNPSVKIIDLMKMIDSKRKIKIIGIRPGEKLHEVMVSKDDWPTTVEKKDHFIIYPKKGNNIKFKDRDEYSSQSNNDKLSAKDLKNWINKNYKNLIESN